MECIIFCVCLFGYLGFVFVPAYITHRTSVRLHQKNREEQKHNEIPAHTDDAVDRLSGLWYI